MKNLNQTKKKNKNKIKLTTVKLYLFKYLSKLLDGFELNSN